ILAARQSCSLGIHRNVVPQIPKLLLASNEMIKSILLPKAAPLVQATIDLRRRKVLPRLTLRQHRLLIGKRREQMDVIGHYDEVKHDIAHAGEMAKAVGNNAGKVGTAQDACSSACVERVLPAIPEAVEYRLGDRASQHLKLLSPGRIERVNSKSTKLL